MSEDEESSSRATVALLVTPVSGTEFSIRDEVFLIRSGIGTMALLPCLLLALFAPPCSAWVSPVFQNRQWTGRNEFQKPLSALEAESSPGAERRSASTRREWISSLLASAVALSVPQVTKADEAIDIPTKTIVDEFFTITIPESYFAIRRRSKGDLPDPKTGEGRRGSSIFTAGDMAKAEVVAVER